MYLGLHLPGSQRTEKSDQGEDQEKAEGEKGWKCAQEEAVTGN